MKERWKKQVESAVKSVDDLRRMFPNARLPEGIAEASARFPMMITPYYASLVKKPDFTDPIFAQSVPDPRELIEPTWLSDDPFNEVEASPVPGLIRRYRDRALLLATSECAMRCRHCTRKRIAGECGVPIMKGERLHRCISFLSEHPEITDVLVSGGDPLLLDDDFVEEIVSAVRAVKSVEIIRIATRTPVTLPIRISKRLAKMLASYGPVYLNTQFNHPVEITPESSKATKILADAGIPLGNQTVLLRGINDNVETLSALFKGLLKIRVRPYYLFQCDLVRGVEHFRTDIDVGLDIIWKLRASIGGMGIPHYVLDTPGGGGKVTMLPESIVRTTEQSFFIRNPSGSVSEYPRADISV